MITEPSFKVEIIGEDPADNKFLECALMANAEYILRGDKHLLKLKNYKNIKIISAIEFINL
jgi:predicted nucleic acid-binding protein